MSYEPTNWKDGDLVTSAKLNKIEQGIAAGGVLITHDEDGTLDKTWQEIYDADACIIYTFTKQDKVFDFVTRVQDAAQSSGDLTPNSVNVTPVLPLSGFVVLTLDRTYIASSPDEYPIIVNLEEGGSGNLSAS